MSKGGAEGSGDSITVCKATGVSHSFGKARSKNGIHELIYASLFIQLGGSFPHRTCKVQRSNTDNNFTLDQNIKAKSNIIMYVQYR